ncbi:MAG: SUMF1/EgtB/PvdO family nonheme iron enzyme, partial [Treponema sp.]|nr:SUMF1/EgtB/PvdO family nonheme iron enzyme [Treponema sp.]
RNDDEFLGWYTDSSFTSQFDFSRPILEDTTLYAKWRRATISSGTFVFVSGNTINTGIDGSLVFVSGRNLVIPNLYVCTHEVTQEQYQSIIGINPSFFSTNPATDERQEKRPVENVKWYDTLVYCNKLSIRDGYTPCYTIKGSTNPDDWGDVPEWKDSDWTGVICDFNVDGYRLPTEVEWEYLARGGNTSNEDQFLYSGSNEYDEVAWTNDTRTHEVERKRPNGLGLYDMSGNVCEWCWDEWVEDDEIDENTPLIPDGLDQVRVRKGGYWNSPYRIENREHNDVNGPGVDNDFIGFRVVRTAN